MITIAGDLGYRFVKGVNGYYRTVLFPSAICQGFDKKHGGGSGMKYNGKPLSQLHVVCNEEDGAKQDYFIGDMALKEVGTAKYLFDEDRAGLKEMKAFIAALVLLLAPSDKRLFFVSGLPYKNHAAQKDGFEAFLRGLDFDASLVGGRDVVISRRIKFDDVRLMPQGIGAVIYASQRHPSLIKGNSDVLGLVDIGGKTTELILFRDEPGGLMLLEEYSDTLEMGMTNVNNVVYRAYHDRTGTNLSDAKVNNLVKRGYVVRRGNRLDFREEINEAKKNLATDIFSRITARWREMDDELTRIIFAGGGSIDLRSYLGNRDYFVFVEDPQFANVHGYHTIARLYMDEMKKGGGSSKVKRIR